jgi:vancomycin resistance protein YoaR
MNATTSKGKKRAGTGAAPRARAVKIAPNPVAERANLDAYDELLAVRPARASRAERVSPKKPAAKRAPAGNRDPYDELVERAERVEKRRRAVKPMDEFDRYIARIEGAPSKAKPKRRSKGASAKGGGPSPSAAWILTGLILVCFLVIGARLYGYANFVRMRNAVERATFYNGTRVEGVDVSNMTLSDAIAYWDANVEPAYANRTATLDDGTGVTAAQMGYQSDYRAVLESVWDDQRAGTLKERYRNLKAQAGATRDYPVTRALYDDGVVREFAAYVASGVDRQGAEASVSGFDPATYTFTFSEGKAGATLDQTKLASDIESTLTAGGGNVTRAIAATTPTVTAADLAKQYGLVASAVTNASSSSAARLANIKLAIQAINGTKLDPGDEFSFNTIVGQRTAERGYQMAPAFSGGEVTEELGGGICQVSTTLFNAAVKSNLEITERHPHSMPVSYVDKGKDATVNWGSQDLKFKNTSDSTIYIMAVVSSDKRVKIGIFGKTLADGISITVEAEVTETYEFDTTYQVNAFLQPGATNVLQAGRTGYKAVAYKVTWSKDGALLSKDVLCTSTYAKRDAIIEISQY